VRNRSHPRVPLAELLAEHGWTVMLYDGACVLCSRSVHFVAARSRRSLIAFSAVQSAAAAPVLRRLGRSASRPDTLLVIEADRVLERSDAVLRLMQRMDAPWPSLARLARPVPRRLRDALYDLIASNRYRLLGRRDRCMLVGPESRRRYLP